ncbi:MAG: undecaprenyldiphospho-muramoylpentapeptide beta-N-acetylglucosaminyltransferase, partial [Elusimicrobiota bacterium]|nr:undecaprenyldiphospho-muramoylpentapeptide beta-N-acetylglucosaminyltransferase [Elusimicrobiota bacterium]
NKNIIIAASGTGGHIYPGLSIANELKNRGYNPIFFISDNETSKTIIKNSSFKYIPFNLSGMPRPISLSFISFCIKLSLSFCKSFIYIYSLKPICVISTGGYIGVPSLFAAKILGKKTYIHEQNVIAGKANRLLSRIASEVFVSFEGSLRYFDAKKTIVTGYPIRKDIFSTDFVKARETLKIDKDKYAILIFGGSLGAKILNEIAFKAVQLLPFKENLCILHIAGQRGYEDLYKKAKDLPFYRVFEYMHDIYNAYSAANLIISRSGAGSVFEIKALNKPAIFIPLANSADNHQLYNAKEAYKENFIEIIEEKNLSADLLHKTILKLQKNSAAISVASEIQAAQMKISDIVLQAAR